LHEGVNVDLTETAVINPLHLKKENEKPSFIRKSLVAVKKYIISPCYRNIAGIIMTASGDEEAVRELSITKQLTSGHKELRTWITAAKKQKEAEDLTKRAIAKTSISYIPIK